MPVILIGLFQRVVPYHFQCVVILASSEERKHWSTSKKDLPCLKIKNETEKIVYNIIFLFHMTIRKFILASSNTGIVYGKEKTYSIQESTPYFRRGVSEQNILMIQIKVHILWFIKLN